MPVLPPFRILLLDPGSAGIAWESGSRDYLPVAVISYDLSGTSKEQGRHQAMAGTVVHEPDTASLLCGLAWAVAER